MREAIPKCLNYLVLPEIDSQMIHELISGSLMWHGVKRNEHKSHSSTISTTISETSVTLKKFLSKKFFAFNF